MKEIARMMMIGGGIIILIGLTLYFVGGYFKWFGKLPGDIRVEKPGFTFYAPITSMLILSGIVSLLIWLFKKIFF